ncbi:hypothetical protein BV898_13387 [Hypsibius exemplaris]|uniref:Uncharacterized protein n=1 Tax=Hypsibius exemplaris TaxID=2072580 RepID=A0A1W0WAX3_HYPEX|nr:hypothetical protein BV898_13387 [Hypsibius exemplaris]
MAACRCNGRPLSKAFWVLVTVRPAAHQPPTRLPSPVIPSVGPSKTPFAQSAERAVARPADRGSLDLADVSADNIQRKAKMQFRAIGPSIRLDRARPASQICCHIFQTQDR